MGRHIVIVGGGVAGLAAAISAKQANAESVVLLEAADAVGGASAMSAGVLMGAGSRNQRALGIQDDAESLYRDFINLSHWAVNAPVIRRLADLAGPTIDWLADLGVPYIKQVFVAGGESLPRSVGVIGRGPALIAALAEQARQLGVEIRTGVRVDELTRFGSSVEGVASRDTRITADAVILATGGFGANPQLLDEWYPLSDSQGGTLRWYGGPGTSLGDGLKLARDAGAEIHGKDTGLRLLHPGFVQQIEAYLPGWLVFVNGDGRRFIDETSAEGVLDRTVNSAGGRIWAIFDAAALDPMAVGSTPAYRVPIPEFGERRTANWSPEALAQALRDGRLTSALTIRELGVSIGVDEDVLDATVSRYNREPETMIDEVGKESRFKRPLTRAPFYAAEVRLASVVITGAGPQIDPNARVLDQQGEPIPGLYAAGEVASGMIGPMYYTGGTLLSAAAVFGRIAGSHAAGATEIPGQDS